MGDIDWIAGSAIAAAGSLGAALAWLSVRGLRLPRLWGLAIALAASVPIWAALTNFATPPIYERKLRRDAAHALTLMPLYGALMRYHPEAQDRIVAAVLKVARDGPDARLGERELERIVTAYFRRYVAIASDESVMLYVRLWTNTAEWFAAHDPPLCSALLRREMGAMLSRLGPQYLAALLQTMGAVVESGISEPQPPVEPAWANRRVQRVIETAMSRGNRIVLDPAGVAADPAQACQALRGLHDAVASVVPPHELGMFFRAVLPGLLPRDET